MEIQAWKIHFRLWSNNEIIELKWLGRIPSCRTTLLLCRLVQASLCDGPFGIKIRISIFWYILDNKHLRNTFLVSFYMWGTLFSDNLNLAKSIWHWKLVIWSILLHKTALLEYIFNIQQHLAKKWDTCQKLPILITLKMANS